MISLVIFGSRTAFPTTGQILAAFEPWWGPHVLDIDNRSLTIISGLARGADTSALEFARFHGLNIVEMPADWNRYGKRAGYIRNREMAERATYGLGFWHRESNGTAHIATCLLALGKPVRIVEWTHG